MVSFEQWLFEVMLVQGMCSEPVLRETVIESLKGTAADLMRYMRPEVEVEGIISKVRNSVWNSSIIQCSGAVIL